MKDKVVYATEFHWQQTHMRLKSDLKECFSNAKSAVMNSRILLEQYILDHPYFVTSLEPIEVDLTAAGFIRNMMQAGLLADVGPMAAVAGGLAEVATETMIAHECKLAIAENGGDISVKGYDQITVGVYAGESQVAKRLGFKIKANELPIAICTSAGSVGHSISLGDADAVVVFSSSAFLADAAATAVANVVKGTDAEGAIQAGLERSDDIEGIFGCMIIYQELVGKTGKIPEMIEVVESDM